MLISTLYYGTISTIAQMIDNECRVKAEMIDTLDKKLEALDGNDVIGNFIVGFKVGAHAQLKINTFNYKVCLSLFHAIKDDIDALDNIETSDNLNESIASNIPIINSVGDLAKKSQERMCNLGL